MYYEHYTEVNLFDICEDVFHEKETYRNDVWSKECMNRILQLGSGISGGKERIYSFFTQYDFSLADRAKFLKTNMVLEEEAMISKIKTKTTDLLTMIQKV